MVAHLTDIAAHRMVAGTSDARCGIADIDVLAKDSFPCSDADLDPLLVPFEEVDVASLDEFNWHAVLHHQGGLQESPDPAFIVVILHSHLEDDVVLLAALEPHFPGLVVEGAFARLLKHLHHVNPSRCLMKTNAIETFMNPTHQGLQRVTSFVGGVKLQVVALADPL